MTLLCCEGPVSSSLSSSFLPFFLVLRIRISLALPPPPAFTLPLPSKRQTVNRQKTLNKHLFQTASPNLFFGPSRLIFRKSGQQNIYTMIVSKARWWISMSHASMLESCETSIGSYWCVCHYHSNPCKKVVDVKNGFGSLAGNSVVTLQERKPQKRKIVPCSPRSQNDLKRC